LKLHDFVNIKPLSEMKIGKFARYKLQVSVSFYKLEEIAELLTKVPAKVPCVTFCWILYVFRLHIRSCTITCTHDRHTL